VCGKEVVQYPSRPRLYCDKKCYGQAKLKTAESFWSRVDVGANGHCWNWRDSASKNGYGTLKFGRRYWYAHQLAWTLTYGPTLGGLWVLHHCDNKRCCNPRHLKLGTVQNNHEDAMLRGKTSHHP
jgi:hypothetical protein